MTYQETLHWMFSRLPMYQQKGASAYNAKLQTSIDFAHYLNNPQEKFKSIHIAGTNGKGSSSHMLASIFQEAGYQVGLYTSPHLKDFRERIKSNGKCISEEEVIAFIEKHRAYLEEHNLSFFELTVGMAFDYFAHREVDIAIVEVGLGGRLDSTNIITPLLSLITNIGYDHQDLLGDTLVKIAKEKAGIIKEGVPVVISEYQEEVAAVFESIAADNNAPLYFASKRRVELPKIALGGEYQEKNAKGVLEVLRHLPAYRIDKEHIQRGLENVYKNTGLLGRWQILAENPLTICDTAHNKEGLTLVLQQLMEISFNELHIVLGFVKEKNLMQILPLFPQKAHYYFCKPEISRGLEAVKLQVEAAKYGLRGQVYASVKEAYREAQNKAGNLDLIYIGGSTFTVAEVV